MLTNKKKKKKEKNDVLTLWWEIIFVVRGILFPFKLYALSSANEPKTTTTNAQKIIIIMSFGNNSLWKNRIKEKKGE